MRRTWAKCCDWGRPTSGKESWDHTVNLTVELRLETQQNSFESSVEGFCDLRGEEIVREQENRLGTGGWGLGLGQEQKNGSLAGLASPSRLSGSWLKWRL